MLLASFSLPALARKGLERSASSLSSLAPHKDSLSMFSQKADVWRSLFVSVVTLAQASSATAAEAVPRTLFGRHAFWDLAGSAPCGCCDRRCSASAGAAGCREDEQQGEEGAPR